MAARCSSPVPWSTCVVYCLVSAIPLENLAGTQRTLYSKPAGRLRIADDLQHLLERQMALIAWFVSAIEFRNSLSHNWWQMINSSSFFLRMRGVIFWARENVVGRKSAHSLRKNMGFLALTSPPTITPPSHHPVQVIYIFWSSVLPSMKLNTLSIWKNGFFLHFFKYE